MAKLFYTLEEAAQKLRKSQDEIMSMARAGQLQELRDKDQVLFRRSAIDQIAGDGDMGSDINLDGLDLSNAGSSMGAMDELRLDDSSVTPVAPVAPAAPAAGRMSPGLNLNDDLSMDDGLRMDDGLSLDDDLRLDAGPIAASGADDSMSLDDLSLADDDEPAPAPTRAPTPAAAPMARSAPPARSPAASSGGSGIGLADSSADSMMMDAPASSGAGRMSSNDDSMSLNSDQTQLEAVGSGSGLLDISSDESFFGAQMIEESMGGEDAVMTENTADIFGGGETAATEEAAPVTSGTSAVTFGAAALAEARDPKFSGFTAGAMIVATIALVGMGWSVTEMMVGNYTDVAKMIAENWMYVLGGTAGAILVFGGIGLGIGKATA
jgi:hypothetical protein